MQSTSGLSYFMLCLCALISSVVHNVCVVVPADAQETKQPAAAPEAGKTNANWLDWPYGSSPITRFGDTSVQVKLIVTAVEGDDRKSADSTWPAFGETRFGCRISMDGRVGYFYHSSLGMKGSGYPQLKEADRQRLDELLDKLPDAASQSPPAGRRLTLQVADGEGFQTRVFDRANAPDNVLEILRLSRSGIGSVFPEFKPASEVKVDRHNSGVLALTPDRKQIVTGSSGEPFRFWDVETHRLVTEIATPNGCSPIDIHYSPDGSYAVVDGRGTSFVLETKTWQLVKQLEEPWIGRRQHLLSDPQFTLNGRYLLLRSSEPALRTFDTTNWEKSTLFPVPPFFPEGALAYVPVPQGGRAVIVTKHNTIALWDTHKRREYATLDQDVKLGRVAFSPDASLVAVATIHRGPGGYWTAYRLRVWRMDTGQLVHELRPREQDVCEAIEGLLWHPNGKYILAATKWHSFWSSRGVGIWNVDHGRQRGELVGCPCDVTGLELLDDGRCLVAGCEDGQMRFWDLAKAMQQISDFELPFEKQ